MNLTVTFQGGTRFEIGNGRHTMVADQPIEDGGADAGMSPVELFVGSLASCVGYFVARFCARHGIPTEGFWINVEWRFAEQPHRVGMVALRLNLPGAITPEQQDRLLKVAHGCTVHQSFTVPPQVEIRLATADDGSPSLIHP